MADAERDEGFLSRWSRRKAQARRAPAGPDQASSATKPDTEHSVDLASTAGIEALPAGHADAPPLHEAPGTESPPLTLADVAQLTRDSDFSRFLAADVKTDVRNAALKKLFSDPRFNVMDGLDVYIDDYNKADPLPGGMLLQMAQARFLGLVREGAEDLIGGRPATVSHRSADAEAQGTGSDAPPEKIACDEDADLQLQPHDAAGRADVEPGPREDGGREH